MRILMVSEDLPGEQVGGLGKHVVTLANRLLAEGHDVEIMGRNDRGIERCAGQIGFRGHFRPGFDYAHAGWKELQMGVFNPLKRPYFARKIAAAIDLHAPGFDVVHYHGHVPMVGLHVDADINFVQTRHDQGSECLTHLRFRDAAVCGTVLPADCAACIQGRAKSAGPMRKSVTAIAVNGYRTQAARAFARHKTVFVSDFLRRQFLRAVPDADLSRCRVIHNFVDYPRILQAARAAASGPAGPAPRAGEVVLVGRLDAGKGFAEFLAASEGRLPPQARVTIVGDGPLRAALAARYGTVGWTEDGAGDVPSDATVALPDAVLEAGREADAMNAREARFAAGPGVHFLGWQDYDTALALAARAHLCVVPSLCEEACSTTVLEALALGRPCVALARGGTPELAVYQQFEGQLQLASTMDELVERVRVGLAEAPRAVAGTVAAADAAADMATDMETDTVAGTSAGTGATTAPLPFGADTARLLPQLLELYAEQTNLFDRYVHLEQRRHAG